MIIILFCPVIFCYIALLKTEYSVIINTYISETYLFAVAQNVGFQKRFAGL
jgi:hypothetical protein